MVNTALEEVAMGNKEFERIYSSSTVLGSKLMHHA
jgi:hypothetical protein